MQTYKKVCLRKKKKKNNPKSRKSSPQTPHQHNNEYSLISTDREENQEASHMSLHIYSPKPLSRPIHQYSRFLDYHKLCFHLVYMQLFVISNLGNQNIQNKFASKAAVFFLRKNSSPEDPSEIFLNI